MSTPHHLNNISQHLTISTPQHLNNSPPHPHHLNNISQHLTISTPQPIMIKNILRLTRPKQWIKNFFVFIPMFFGGELFDLHSIELVTLTFFAYSFVASSIYCYNDIVDVDADRNHPVKCQRPIASGALSIRMGYTLMIVMFVLGIGVALTLPPEVMSNVMAVIVFYYVLNLKLLRHLFSKRSETSFPRSGTV